MRRLTALVAFATLLTTWVIAQDATSYQHLASVARFWALVKYLHFDAGKVVSGARDLDLKDPQRSYGAGLRLHDSFTTLARLDVGSLALRLRRWSQSLDSIT